MDFKIDLATIKIETERLILRPFAESDLEDLYAYASVPGVGEQAGWPHHETIESSKEILDSFLEQMEVFAIYHKADRKVIGSLGLHRSWANEEEAYQDLKVKELGYVLAKDYWGQGLMPEAVRGVLGYGFQVLNIDAFSCSHFLKNDQSRQVIEKCGFQYVRNGEYYSAPMQRTYADQKYILLNSEKAENR